jgi:chloramphenicol-sensitive protein RarD
LLLASSFSIYAALKRGLRAPALLALLYETGLVVPMALPILIYLESTGQGVLATVDITHLVVLGFAGIITAIPLLLFGLAANRISMITLGLTEYISPSLTLVFGIFMFNEPFDMIKFMGFVIIWIGLVIFTVGEVKSFPSGGEGVERL